MMSYFIIIRHTQVTMFAMLDADNLSIYNLSVTLFFQHSFSFIL